MGSKKSSKEKIMEKMTAPMVAPMKNNTSGYFSVRWEKRNVDGTTKTFLSVDDDSDRDYSKPAPPRKEYTDKDEFISVVSEKIGNFIKDAG